MDKPKSVLAEHHIQILIEQAIAKMPMATRFTLDIQEALDRVGLKIVAK